MKKRKYYAIIDNDGDVRYTFLYLSWAFEKRKELGWGKVYEIDIKKKGEELK